MLPAGAQQQDLSGFHATETELLSIPQYCWGTFGEKYRKPGMEAFNLPGGCGERFNHFCPGVLSLARARAPSADAAKRGYWVGRAFDHMRYTVDGIQNQPNCPMRHIVDGYMQEILRMRGGR